MSDADLQELYTKFDGVDGNTRLAWYGQSRAKGMSHDEAMVDTARKYPYWVLEVWPKRKIPIAKDLFPCTCGDGYRAVNGPLHRSICLRSRV